MATIVAPVCCQNWSSPTVLPLPGFRDAAAVVRQALRRAARLVEDGGAQLRHLPVQLLLLGEQAAQAALLFLQVVSARAQVQVAPGVVGGEDVDTALLLHLHDLHVGQQTQRAAHRLR